MRLPMNKRQASKVLIACILSAGALVTYRSVGWDYLGQVNRLELDLARPDALILTQSLSSLPRDLLTIPLARDVLREDVVFYYEQGEDRLGLKGSLRRIAYEHELGWGDELIRMVLDQPAEVALWRDADGTLKHYAIAVSRGNLARLFEEAGKVALKDAQLRRAGELPVGAGKVPVYAFEYAHGRTLLFVAQGERMVILSHPGMLYGAPKAAAPDTAKADAQEANEDSAPAPQKEPVLDANAAAIVAGLLGADPKARAVFRQPFQLAAGIPAGHSVVVGTDFLSFGYQPFFGALQALRFDFSRGRWASQVLIDGARLQKGGYDSSALWSSLPHGASACFSVPADWNAMAQVTARFGQAEALRALPAQFAGPVAACWYPSSRLYTPVFIAQRTAAASSPQGAASLDTLFAATVGAGSGSGSGSGAAPDPGARLWQREVATPAGPMVPTLAASGRTVAFSADPVLVERVLAVARKQAPAVADGLPAPGRTVGMVSPAPLAQLVRKEAFEALPADSEQVLRGAADAHLVPRLAALGKYPPYRMVVKSVPASGLSWTTLEWQPVK